jgi:hypothetical protein
VPTPNPRLDSGIAVGAWSDERAKTEMIPNHTSAGVQMSTKLSSSSSPQEAILATVKEELVNRLQLYVEPENEDVNTVTFAAVAAAIQARWVSI